MSHLTEEDKENIRFILNSEAYTVERLLQEIERAENEKIENNFEELTVMLSSIDAATSHAITSKYPRLVALLNNNEWYKKACILLGDMSQNAHSVQQAFYDLDIFRLLNFEWGYNESMYLVFSLCVNNKRNWEYFFDKMYDEKRDEGNPRIINLREHGCNFDQ